MHIRRKRSEQKTHVHTGKHACIHTEPHVYVCIQIIGVCVQILVQPDVFAQAMVAAASAAIVRAQTSNPYHTRLRAHTGSVVELLEALCIRDT